MDMTSREFRQAHLWQAIDEYGTTENLARVLGMNPAYLSQLKIGTRGIGHKTARKIEAGLGWPSGHMDTPLGDGGEMSLSYLIKTLPESETIKAITDAMPTLSDEAVKQVAAALLQRFSVEPPATPEQ